MSIFPKERIQEYLSSNVIPDEVIFPDNNSSIATVEKLCQHGNSVLRYLEENKSGNYNYPTNGIIYQSMFTKFDEYYRREGSNIGSKDSIFKLIRIEQSLHFINSMQFTQDIFPYLKLVEEFSYDQKICELVLLLTRKYDVWYNGYAEVNLDWMHYLIPFVRYMEKMNLDFDMIYHTDTNMAKQIIRENLDELQQILKKQDQQIVFHGERYNETGDLLELFRPLNALKEALSEESIPRNNDFYHTLGQLTFLYHFVKFTTAQDYTFIKVCIIATLYLPKIKLIINSHPTIIPTFYQFEKIPFNSFNWKELAVNLCYEIKQESKNNRDNAMNKIELLECLLSVHGAKTAEDSKYFLQAAKGSELPLLTEFSKIIFNFEDVLQSQDSPYHGDFLTYFEYFVILILSLTERIQENIGNSSKEAMQVWDIAIESIFPNIKVKSLRLFVKDKYYARQYFKVIRAKHLNLSQQFIENLNFSEQTLEEIINSQQQIDLEDLYINLSQSLRVFKGSSEVVSLYEKEPKSILQAIQAYVGKLQEKTETEYDASKIKYLGIFLMAAINYNIPSLAEFKFEFITLFIKFLTQEQEKCKLNKWDLTWLQENLWLAISKVSEGQNIMLNQSTYDLLAIFRDKLAITQKKCTTFKASSTMITSPEIQRKLYEMLIAELDNTIAKEIPDFWNRICNSQAKSVKDSSPYQLASFSVRKLINFTLPWLDSLMKALKPKEKPEDLAMVTEILNHTCSFHFHPLNNLLLNRNALLMFHKQWTAFSQLNDFTLWAAIANFANVLNEKLLDLNQELSTKTSDEISLTQFINQIRFESTCLPISEEQSITFDQMSTAQIKLQNFMLGVSKCSYIITKTCVCPFSEEQQDKIVDAYRPTLASLKEFILKIVIWLTSVNTEDRSRQEAFIQKLISGTQTILKSLSQIVKAQPIVAEFILDLTSECLAILEKPYSEHLMSFILTVILNLGSAMEKHIVYPLLCNLKIWKPIISQAKVIINQLMKPSEMSKQTYKLIRSKADLIRRFIGILQPKFKTLADFAEIDKLATKINPEMALVDFKKNMSTIITEQLHDFPFLEMLTLNLETLNNLFTKLLMILEMSNLEVLKSLAAQKTKLANDIHYYQNALTRQMKKSDNLEVYEGDFHAMNSMFGDDEDDLEEEVSPIENPQSPEIVEQNNPLNQAEVPKEMDPECKRLEGLINEKKEALKLLKESENEEIYSAITKYGVLYNFEELAKTEAKKIALIRRSGGVSLVKFLHAFNCKILQEENSAPPLEGPDQDKIEDILLLEASTAKKSVYNNILTLEAYLQPTINMLATGTTNLVIQDSFLQCLMKGSMRIFEEFVSQDSKELKSESDELLTKHDLFKRLCTLVESETKLLMTYFTCNYLRDETPKDQAIFIFKWVKLMLDLHNVLQNSVDVTLINPVGTFFGDLMGLLQVSLFCGPSSEYMDLLEETKLLETILKYESKQAMKMSFIKPLSWIFDSLLEKSIPLELLIERDIKSVLVNSVHYKGRLMDLTNHSHISEKEKCVKDALAAVAQDKFKVYSKIEDPNSETRFAQENIYILIDLAREPYSPLPKIEEIIQSMSGNARKILDLLTDSIITNFLEVISKLAQCTDLKQIFESAFRETSSLITILSLIFQKNKLLLLYPVFKKKDYRHLIQKFNSKLDFLGKVDIEDFKSVTFLECLFKINYFSLYAEDLFVLIRTFLNPIGVTFLNPADHAILLDVTHFIINHVLRLLHQNLTQRNKYNNSNPESSIYSYLTVCTTVRAFVFIWFNIDQNFPRAGFQNYFKEEVLSLLKDILSVTKLYIKPHYNVLKNGGAYEEPLMGQLKTYRTGLLSSSDISNDALDLFKRESYREVLEGESFGMPIPHGDLNKLFNEPLPSIAEDESTVRKYYPYSENEEMYKIDLALKAISRSSAAENYVQLPLYRSTSITASESWSSMMSKKTTCLMGIKTWCLKDEEQNGGIEAQLKTIIKNFVGYLEHRKFDLESNSGFYRTIPAGFTIKAAPILDTTKVNKKPLPPLTVRFFQIVADQMKAKSQLEESKNEKDQGQPEVQSGTEPGTEPRPNNIESKAEAKEEQKIEGNENTLELINEEKIKYFFHPTLQQRQEFDLYRQQITSRLKVLSERALTAIAYSGLSNGTSEAFKKDTVNEEIKQEVASLSDFERNMLYCLVILYDTLKSFEYPENMPDIRTEFDWIQSNFAEYIARLNKVRDPESSNNDSVVNNNIVPEFTFPEEFQFVTDASPNLTQQNITVESTKALYKAKASLFQQMYLLDEDVVESLLSYFYMADDDNIKAFAPSATGLLVELCYSPQFEAKIIDFCLFFLYCPEHLQVVSSNNKLVFPYPKILNTELAHSQSRIYQIVASNIISFLKSYLIQVEHMVYQPRTYVEQFGLKSIKDMKPKTDFTIKTKGSVSINDLIIGLIDVKEINTNPKLLIAFEDLIINGIFNKTKDFKILEIKEGEEYIETKGLLSFESCNRLLRLNKVDSLFKKFPTIWLHNYKALLKDFEGKVDLLSEIVDKTNRVIKKKIEDTKDNLTQNDLSEILSQETVLTGLGELFNSVSSVVTAWFEKTRKSQAKAPKDEKSQENERLFEKLFKALSTRFLNEKQFEDFMIQLFELANYLALRGALQQQSKLKSLASSIAKICLPFYALICVQESLKKANSQNKEDSPAQIELPSLSHIVSTESVGDNQEVPVLQQTFSSLRRSREFDFSVLFSDLCKRHSDSVLQIAFEDTNKTRLTKELAIICSRLPWVLDLSTKRKILTEAINRNLRELDASTNSRNLGIDRRNLLKSTLTEFSNRPLKTLRKKISITFTNENGTDAGGLTREYLTIINRELFDPRNGLFQLSANQANIQPSPNAKLIPSHLKYLQLAGMALAKAIQHECVVDVNLSRPFLKHILKKRIALNDLEDIDSDLAKSLKWMLENSVEVLEQPFTYEAETLGQKITKELAVNGYDTIVDEENKKTFVKRVCEMKMKEEIQEELLAFLQGFHLMIPPEFLSHFSTSELQLLIAGIPTISVDDLKAHANLSGYTKESEQIKWLWEIFSEFSQKELASFIFFVSGSLKIPYGGYKERPIRYRYASFSPNKLPVAHTCSWEIELPAYKTKEEMKQKLLLAIYEGQESFMLN